MAFEYLQNASRQNEHNNELIMWRSSIPPALKGYDLDELLETQWNGKISKISVGRIKDYLKDPSTFLLLYGASGLGKTIMGVLVMDKFIEEGVVESALYIDSPTLLYELSYGDKRQENMINKMSRPDILLIDDAGAGSTDLTNIRRDGLWSIINNRWLEDKKTIITTNLPMTKSNYNSDIPTIQSWFGDAAWDRIASKLSLINFQGESMRRKGTKKNRKFQPTVDTIPTLGKEMNNQ